MIAVKQKHGSFLHIERMNDVMFELFEKVKIKSKDLVGTIVDIYKSDGKDVFIVESDVRMYTDDPDAYGGEYPMYDCHEGEIERVSG